ncbi:response regulator [Exilibacterium tricleocarpae]|uniref:Response regulator n=1 Tax=Exilibacterium tricleocarpae TaxID=2591008 RepID=A0A545SP29_9GAMM|nr:response regulator [Exilibacterium tricleocarpae]TQV66704.1 response regulator [Exilibacterium tricleocarpae]
MTELPLIAVVDDEPANLRLLERALERRYRVVSLSSGPALLERFNSQTPDLILLDVMMPEVSGYQTCQMLREHKLGKAVPVIFVSALSALEDIVKGYEVGAYDYITKPVMLEELMAKVAACLKFHRDAQHQIEAAQQAASAAIHSVGELGTIMNFYEEIFGCKDLSSLGEALTRCLRALDLEASVQLRAGGETRNFSTHPAGCSPIEAELMGRLLGREPIIRFNKRTAFTCESVSTLVKDRRHDGAGAGEYAGDHVARVLKGVEDRIGVIELEKQKEREVLSRVREELAEIDSAVAEVECMFQHRDSQTSKIIDQLLGRLNGAFATPVLTQGQERFLAELVNDHMEMIMEIYTSGSEIDRRFNSISKMLVNIAGKNADNYCDSAAT